jgi:hypothetical protein
MNFQQAISIINQYKDNTNEVLTRRFLNWTEKPILCFEHKSQFTFSDIECDVHTIHEQYITNCLINNYCEDITQSTDQFVFDKSYITLIFRPILTDDHLLYIDVCYCSLNKYSYIYIYGGWLNKKIPFNNNNDLNNILSGILNEYRAIYKKHKDEKAKQIFGQNMFRISSKLQSSNILI